MVATPPARELKYDLYGVKVFSDGSCDRTVHDQLYPTTTPTSQHHPHQPYLGAFSNDALIDTNTRLWARIFLPETAALEAADRSSDQEAQKSKERKKKLPLIVYLHGGGFVVCTADSVQYHDFGSKVAAGMEAIVVCVNYRNTPEHRLPAAYEDSMAALKWLQKQAQRADESDPWLRSHADFGKCFLMGDSAGANIMAHILLRASSVELLPLRLIGLVFVMPFFGGIERTNSEILFGDNEVMTLEDTDNFWDLSLPIGADRSHPFCVFLTQETLDMLQTLELPPSLVVVGRKDPLYDRQMQFVDALRKSRHSVTLLQYEENGHDFLFPELDNTLYKKCTKEDVAKAYVNFKDFMSQCMTGSIVIENAEGGQVNELSDVSI